MSKILSIAPTRISLFGGGTDISTYSDIYGGLTINMAINLRQKMVMYSDDELFELHGKSVFPYGADPNFCYKILEEYGINDGVHLTKLICNFDGLIESGIGSSASAAVALLGAINKRKKLGMSIEEIAQKAWDLEVNKLGLYGGKQDQYIAAYGGVNVMQFSKKGVEVTSLAQGYINKLEPYLMLFYTGSNRKSAIIQEGFRELNEDQIATLHSIKALAYNAIEPIRRGDYVEVGRLLAESWELKKLSNKGVSNTRIDQIYDTAIGSGALGGKILGAGGGGFMLFICPLEKQHTLISKLEELNVEYWDFSIDYNGLEVRDITGK